MKDERNIAAHGDTAAEPSYEESQVTVSAIDVQSEIMVGAESDVQDSAADSGSGLQSSISAIESVAADVTTTSTETMIVTAAESASDALVEPTTDTEPTFSAGSTEAANEPINDVESERAERVAVPAGAGAMVAKVVRALFHPMFISLYLSMLILFGRMMTLHMSARLNLHVLSIIVLNTIIIPCVYILMLRTARMLAYGRHQRGITAKHERILLILILVVGFAISAWNFKGVELLFMFRRIMVALMACTVLGFLLDRFGRADFHMLGMGAMTGAVWIIIYAGYVKMVVPFCIILMCSSLVAASTIWLERGTLLRVSANYLMAAALSSLVILIA